MSITNEPPASTSTAGRSFRFGAHTITTERRYGDWIAFLDGDRARWEAGASEAEAGWKVVVSYGERGA